MPENVQSVNSVNLNPQTNLIAQKQREYQYDSVPSKESLNEDIVEIQGVRKDKSQIKKYAYITAGVLTAVLTTVGVVFGYRKIKTKKAEKEAQKLAQEARERAQKLAQEAQERARQEALAKEEALKQAELERQAKAKAEAEARAKAEAQRIEKEKETQRIAGINAYNAKVKKITTDFEESYTIKICNKSDRELPFDELKELKKPISFVTLDDYAQGFVESIKKAEDVGIKSEDISKIYQKMHDSGNLSDAEIEKLTKSYEQVYSYSYKVKHQLMARRNFIRDLDKLKTEIPQNSNEKLSDYLQRLVNKRKENVELEKQQRIETIKSRLHYDESEPVIENIELTSEEVEELRNALVHYKVSKKEKELIQKADLSKLISEYILESTGDYDAPKVSDRIQKACFSRMNRYNSKTSPKEYDWNTDMTYEHEPLYRWMYMGNKCDEFAEQTFKIGGTYTFPSKQSCSKNKYFGETQYSEHNPTMNLKFVIHPKSETSRAVDMGYGYYGCNEAVYCKGEKFRVIDIYDEEVTNSSAELGTLAFENEKSFYHKVVHLQEL